MNLYEKQDWEGSIYYIDNEIRNIMRNFRDVHGYLNPLNEQEERALFIEGRTDAPRFVYKEPSYDFKYVEERLGDIKEKIVCCLEYPFSKLYLEKINELTLINELLQNIGKREKMVYLSSKLYGLPSEFLVEFSYRILDNVVNTKEVSEKMFTSEYLANYFREIMRSYGIDDWKVEVYEGNNVQFYAMENKILVPRYRRFSYKEMNRLRVHEIGVHFLRSINGKMQPYKIFYFGFPNYLSTEEGLAVYVEYLTGFVDSYMLRQYAGRVLAVYSVVENKSFRECYEMLLEKGFSKDEAWKLTLRAYRGGGFVKDHVYLQGYVDIATRKPSKDDLIALYTGKVSLKNLDLIKMLLKEGKIKYPLHTPSFI